MIYSRALREAYGVTDSPLVHNTKVNLGLRPRGLCWHWADDLEARLGQERFGSLILHRAIANADNSFRIDHSTVIISAVGQGMNEGVVLDPWRNGGALLLAAGQLRGIGLRLVTDANFGKVAASCLLNLGRRAFQNGDRGLHDVL